ncbi:MAG: hypothetical protein M1825_000463 [Sarcosagium campestre]|nr:MAG: hypothetical protein M1825_000463 [Sarcosagium campestre]
MGVNPMSSLLFVASLFDDQPLLVDISSPISVKHVLPSAPKRTKLESSGDDDEATAKQAAQDAKQTTCVTIFTASGNHIFAGTNKGWLNIISTTTHLPVYSTRLSNGVIIFLRLSKSGRDMVANSSDRIIRTLHVPALDDPRLDWDNISIEVEHKFQDVVNRLSWNHVAFSSTGEYVTASTYKNHDIYVWERSHGSLVKLLEGPKEELGVVEWHPHRPLVSACGLESGRIYLWTITTPQRWSALAPDFAEVEENVEYVEREDEFDIHPISVIQKRRLDREDEDIDVLNVVPTKAGEDEEGEEEGQHAFRMPVLLDLSDSESEEEVIAIGPGTMRRKSPGEGREWMNGTAEHGLNGEEKSTRKHASEATTPTTNGAAPSSKRVRKR